MGVAASSSPSPAQRRRTALGDLPENCVAEVLLRLDPPEICSFARLSRTFRCAADGDGLWLAKLPRNYPDLLLLAAPCRADGSDISHPFEQLTKKQIYAILCRHNQFDGGTKEFWLEKGGRGVCLLISSRALVITGIDDRRYWNFIRTNESRFSTVAYLQQIWWFEVRGSVDFCFPEGTYSLFFRVHLGRPSKRFGRRFCVLEHIHGWDIKPVRFQLATSDGQHAQSKSYLSEPGVWLPQYVGDFVVKDSSSPIHVEFSMTQIDCTHTKGGLCVDSVLILPKGIPPQRLASTFWCQ